MTEEARLPDPFTPADGDPVFGLVRLWLGEPGDGAEAGQALGDTVNCLFSAGLRLATVRSLLQAMPNHELSDLASEADERVEQALDEIDEALQGLRRTVWLARNNGSSVQ